MRTLALAAGRRRIDYLKLVAVTGALFGSWAILLGACRALYAVIG
jgi:hypothetical protein